jgi:hypothetical protein
MSIAAIIILMIVIIVIAAAGFVVLKLAYSPGNVQPSYTVAQTLTPAANPPISGTPKPGGIRGEPGRERPRKKDLRDAPLPRCPKCGTAIAYMEEKCSKCGTAIDIRLMRNGP